MISVASCGAREAGRRGRSTSVAVMVRQDPSITKVRQEDVDSSTSQGL